MELVVGGGKREGVLCPRKRPLRRWFSAIQTLFSSELSLVLQLKDSTLPIEMVQGLTLKYYIEICQRRSEM